MAKKIQILSDRTINQIAAGEVIENPASVVKELVENSLDAGSTEIVVLIKGGGFLLIQVSDNGEGMHPDDAYLAFERHATSKIKEFTDLTEIRSMGFRGEALASIGAVAKVDLDTCDGKTSTSVSCYGGKMIPRERVSQVQGTTISVSSLFYNVPARKKFQKTAQQATTDIVKMMTRLMLAHKNVSFTLISHEKELLKTGGDPNTALDEVLGKTFFKEPKPVRFEENGHVLEGVIGSPLDVRQNRLGQYFFVNGRPIYSPLIARAVKEGFKTRIGVRDYPLFSLWMTLPPSMVDVNVHPQKSEVRFQHEPMIEHFVRRAVEGALVKKEGFSLPPMEKISYREPIYAKTVVEPLFEEEEKDPFVMTRAETKVEVLFIQKPYAFCHIERDEFLEKELVLLDLVKAKMRIQFEEILKRLETKGGEMQTLMFPKVVNFTREESQIIESQTDLLQKIGIGIRPFGKECFIVDAIAPFFAIEEVEVFLKECIEEFRNEEATSARQKMYEEGLAKKASRYVRGGVSSPLEIKEILLLLLQTSDPYHAPNGAKTMTILSQPVLEKWLKE